MGSSADGILAYGYGSEQLGRREHDVPELPVRMRSLPLDRHDRPIPWFVATLADGTRDFRVADPDRWVDAVRFRLCWVCGQALGRHLAFVLGPMCALNRVSSEPPSHRDCAVYSARACPFLANPAMRRRTSNLPDHKDSSGGVMLTRNPGVALVWVTTRYRVERVAGGHLVFFDDPTETLWYRDARPATRVEVLASIDSGLPLLQAACQEDDDPEASLASLADQYERALRLAPAESEVSLHG